MPLNTDISAALLLLEQVHECVDKCDDPKLKMHTSPDLKALISLLQDPVFRSIVTIQDSLSDLNAQLGQHPSILPGDFDVNLSGQLELSLPNTTARPLGPNMYSDTYQDSSEAEDQRVPVAQLVRSSSEDTSAQVTSPSLASEDLSMPPITTPTYVKEFQKVIEAASKGRQIYTVQLYKPEGTSLGFSVVGLRSKDKGELGIFLQEIQPNGIAGCDGRLVEGDQILAIDGQPLDSNISHEQAISILQKARGLVELVVARSAQEVGSSLTPDELSGASSSTPTAGGTSGGGVGTAGGSQPHSDRDLQSSASVSASTAVTSFAAPIVSAVSATATQNNASSSATAPGLVVERSPSAVSDASRTGSDMVLNTEWAQVEVINLINDGSGLGFGIIGGRSTGVVVKTILPGGVADRDNRLQSGDHILQIGDVNLRGMGSEQVAAVLRQSGTHVRLVVARPVEPTSPDYQALGSHAPIVPTRILGDPDELERHLVHSTPETNRHGSTDSNYNNGYTYVQEPEVEMHARSGLIMDVVRNPVPISAAPVISSTPGVQIPNLPILSMDSIDIGGLPEMERFTVDLKKDIYGLGITIAGYVCEKEELSGIFVKSISEGSAADLSNKIQINDRIVEVDGHSLQGYSNHEAVEVLRSTGQTVSLCLERYLRGPKYDTLQQAIAASEQGPQQQQQQPGSPSIASLPSFPISADGETTTEIEPEGESHTTIDSGVLREREHDEFDEEDEASNVEALLSDPSSELTPQIRAAIRAKWQKITGPDTEIVVAQLKKFAEGSGLGISLEGTVDVEDGQEVRPHHYIRSILPEGPVGQNGCLRSGDELLEVNGYRLLGINHMEVVSVLKELPLHVRMVCGRNIASQDPLCPIDTAQHQAAFQTRSILGGSLQNLLPAMDRLVKAKSDGSLASTTTTATVTDASLSKMKSRSLEPLTGLAMWSSEPQIIELVKGERGLGFSILDYQDPMNPNETVIVIRSLVPGGVAQVDGQLIPGDRLLFVNDIALENATLDQAVQALKGAPKGTVRIGVAKPLPIPDSIAQLVTPICIVRRTRSLPGDSESTDQPGDLDDLTDLNDLASSKSDSSRKREQEVAEEEEEEGDLFEDASPLTPVRSPARKTSKPETAGGLKISRKSEEADNNSSGFAREESTDPSTRIPQLTPQTRVNFVEEGEISEDFAVYDTGPSTSHHREKLRNVPAVDKNVENRSVSFEGAEIVKNAAIGKGSVIGRRSTSLEASEIGEKSAIGNESPRNDESTIGIGSLRDYRAIGSEESMIDERTTRVPEKADASLDEERAIGKDRFVIGKGSIEEARSTIGKGSAIVEEPIGGEKNEIGGRSVIEKESIVDERSPIERDSSIEEYDSSVRGEPTIGKESVDDEERSVIAIDRESVAGNESAIGKGKVPETYRTSPRIRTSTSENSFVDVQRLSGRRKSLGREIDNDEARRLSLKERRKSLKEQKSIEKVTEYLSKRGREVIYDFGADFSTRVEAAKTPRRESLTVDAARQSVTSERRKSLTKQENVEESAAPIFGEENPTAAEEIGEEIVERSGHAAASCEPKIGSSRRSEGILARKGGSFERKEVTIRESVVEIAYEYPVAEQSVAMIPEVQLVRARIISAEEATANVISNRASKARVELESPPEIVRLPQQTPAKCSETLSSSSSFARGMTVPEAVTVREIMTMPETRGKVTTTATTTREKKIVAASSAEEDAASGLLDLPKLMKSTSENVLVEIEEESKISGRNFKPDVILDLSKMTEDGEPPKEKRPLSRVLSEGSRNVDDSALVPTLPKTSLDALRILPETLPTDFRGAPEPICPSPGITFTPGTSNLRDNREETGDILADDRASTDLADLSVTNVDSRVRREDAACAEKLGTEASSSSLGKAESATRIGLTLRKSETSYKSVSERLREREFNGTFFAKTEASADKSPVGLKNFPEFSAKSPQILETDREAEEQSSLALAKRKEHEKFLQDYNRSRIGEESTQDSKVVVGRDEDNLIGKPHSLEYLRQTLETRAEVVEEESKEVQESQIFESESVRSPIGESKDPETRGPSETEESRRLERREVETQTHQETKCTQCSIEEFFETPLGLPSLTSLREAVALGESPRKEVETQTQGESKGTQCDLEDLCETYDQLRTLFRRNSFESSLGSLGSIGSPRREVEVQTEQESKGVQCSPEDTSKSLILEGRSSSASRKEAFAQTFQESKAVQFSDDALPRSPTILWRPIDPEAPSSSRVVPLPNTSPIIVLVDGSRNMTVTHNFKDKDGNVVWAKHWGPERMVEIYREPKSSLGLSIVGGKVDLYHGGPNASKNISGIFIKNVLPNSPAGRTGELRTGDRIIEVDGVDLRNSTHDRAVQAIQSAGNPVCLLVQSLVHLSPDEEGATSTSRDTLDEDTGRGIRRQGTRGYGAIVGAAPGTPTASYRRKPPPVSPARTITPELIQEGIEDEDRQSGSRSDFRRQSTRSDRDGAGSSIKRSSMKHSMRKKAPSPPKGASMLREVSEEAEESVQQAPSAGPKPKYSSDESSDEEDTRDLEGNIYTKSGVEISRKSAGNVKRSKEEIEADPEQEDEFGYTAQKIKKRYDSLGHPVIMVRLEKDRRGLGISLAGHKDRNRMAVFVCGLNPKGIAHKTGGLHIGDEILEVNGTVLQGRCHLNASAMIKGMAGPCFKVIVLRRSSAVNDLAVKPIVQFPPSLDEDDPNRFSQYKGVRTISIKKGQYGLGIMIIEGKHAEVGQGIFVSDIQEGSAAELAGLQVGDMILAVNLDSLLGSNYDEATGLLKKTEGVVTLTVCNPNQSKVAKEEEDKAKGIDTTVPEVAAEPEKPKEPEPPKDPKDCEITVGRETTIEFPKDKEKAIGFSIIGGSDTPLGGVVILEVFAEGAAAKDGRLKAGDQIIDFCHESFKAIEHSKAHEAILKASGTIQMIVLREEKPPDEFEVELPKKSGKGVGLCLTGFKVGKGAYVSDMLPGGSALESGKIIKGDRVVAVGAQEVREAAVEDVALHVKLSNPVQLKLARYKPVKQ